MTMWITYKHTSAWLWHPLHCLVPWNPRWCHPLKCWICKMLASGRGWGDIGTSPESWFRGHQGDREAAVLWLHQQEVPEDLRSQPSKICGGNYILSGNMKTNSKNEFRSLEFFLKFCTFIVHRHMNPHVQVGMQIQSRKIHMKITNFRCICTRSFQCTCIRKLSFLYDFLEVSSHSNFCMWLHM